MGFFSWISDTVSSAWEGVKSVASKVWEGAKKVATKVIDTCVDIGGKVVDTVKNVWNTVKDAAKTIQPFLGTIRKAVNMVGNTVGLYFPWVKTAAVAIEKGLLFLEKLDKNPLVKKVTKAIDWALNKANEIVETAKNIKTFILSKFEVNEAVQRQQDLQEAYDLMQTEEQRRSVRFSMLINDFLLVKTRISEALESFETSESTNFDHYLRLRATQKLLRVTEKRLRNANDLSEISDDDLFLIRTGTDLLAEKPVLSEQDGIRLDKIIQRRFNGKKLLPFVFEELISSWTTKYKSLENQWNRMNESLANKKYKLKELEVKDSVQGLSKNQITELLYLKESIREDQFELKEKANQKRAMSKYIYASEGFLQVLEKPEEYWINNDREYILEESEEIGKLLIQCMERQTYWDELSYDEQSLINDFAIIFEKDSKARQEEWIKNEAEELYTIEVAI